MADLKLNLKLSQQLVMTPQLQQAIKLLQMSRLELQNTISKELLENPVLEETGVDESVDAEESKTDDIDWEEYLEDSYESTSSTPSIVENKRLEDLPNYENILTKTETLSDYLLWQLKMSGLNEKEQEFGEHIVENIRDDGYLGLSWEEIISKSKLSPETSEEVLLRIHEFDPVGVGARDLPECLLIQARQLPLNNKLVIPIIKNHISELESKNYSAIAKNLKVEMDEILEAIKIIHGLEPKPGRMFAPSDAQYITPDIYVIKVGEEYIINLNEDGLPKLKISSYYKKLMSAESPDQETKEYVQDRLKSAVWLIRSIHQRQKTIYRVTESIVKRQKEFLDSGVSFLSPMILRDIAADIDMHESTVSRVTTNKFVHTPQGIFELKFFFNTSIGSVAGGQGIASESVKERIRDLVASEDVAKPYSDQDICEKLKEFNINIARRTVAKYRDMLSILPSSKRKVRIK